MKWKDFLLDHIVLVYGSILLNTLISFILWSLDFSDQLILTYNVIIFIFLLSMLFYFYRRYLKLLRQIENRIEKGHPLHAFDVVERSYSQSEYVLMKRLQTLTNLLQKAYYQEIQKTKDFEEQIEYFIHDLKTPLATIKLIELDQEKPNQDILSLSEKMMRKLNQVLFFAKLDHIETNMIYRYQSLDRIVEKVLINNKRYFIANKTKVQLDLEDVSAYVDEQSLVFTLEQLLFNAVKYKKGEAAEIEIQTKKDKDSAYLTISDRGKGIPSDELSRIFERGFIGQGNVENSSGIGLYLVKKILDMQEIQVSVESQENIGTCFQLVFKNITKM